MAPVVAEVDVVDRDCATVTLPAGRYWMTAANAGYLKVSSCRSHGVSPVS